ncbi:hypothetical protein ACM1RC_25930 [Paenibacillus azoreducens]|uniref:hypothetical protein n=1 Tax=Paenibacillus azoreducens TaxID=116718 RepID=UPI0039F4D060
MTNIKKMAQVYFSISESMKSNTDEIMRVLEADGVESHTFQRLWVERESAFNSWTNVAAALRELPLDEALNVLGEVDSLRAQIG